MSQLAIEAVGPEQATEVYAVIKAAFSARPPLDPPAAALSETAESVAHALRHGGMLATRDGTPVAALLFDPDPIDPDPIHAGVLWIRRFGVIPQAQHTGVAGALLQAAVAQAMARGFGWISVIARAELPATVGFWRSHGFVDVAPDPDGVSLRLSRLLPHTVLAPDREATVDLAARLAIVLRAGDLVILTGDLGAGKTTFTQGLGAALGVRGEVTSPTFVIAREHRPTGSGPGLVHVDAYRLGGGAELDDLDLDTALTEAVTVVEWGEGLAEALAEDRLELTLRRPDPDSETREIDIRLVGERWT